MEVHSSGNARIQWGRVIVGAFLLEAALIALFVPMLGWLGAERVVPYVPFGGYRAGIAVWLVGRRKVRSRSVCAWSTRWIPGDGDLPRHGPGTTWRHSAGYRDVRIFLFVLGNGLRIVLCGGRLCVSPTH